MYRRTGATITHHPIVIIGGGPAGIACTIQLYNAGLRPLLIEKDELGGLLRSANLVENYPGFPAGIRGIDLAQLFAEHLTYFNPELLHAEVTNVNWDGSLFRIEVEAGKITANTLIIATGTIPKGPPAVFLQPKLAGRVYNEIIPLMEVKNKTIVIVGSGDAAFDYALNLAGRNNQIIILSHSSRASCLDILWQRATVQNIMFVPKATVVKLELGSDLKLRVGFTGGKANKELVVDYLLLAIGREPNLNLLNPQFVEKSRSLVENERLIAIGDVINEDMRQTAISVGQGILTAMSIIKKQKQHADS